MKSLTLIIVAIIIIAGLTIFAYLYQVRENSLSASLVPQFTTQPTPSPLPSPSGINKEQLMQGGSSYRDPKGVFTFLYPADYKQDTQNNSTQVRIYKQGPTQKGQTEMYDGVILVFESVDLAGKNLTQWVDERINESKQNGEITEPKRRVELNTYPGFSFKVRGLGESQYLVLQKENSQSAVLITYMVADPENIGFQSEVDNILLTLELLK